VQSHDALSDGRAATSCDNGDRSRGDESCPGCAVRLAASGGPTHRYIGASPACWALYGRALERAYSDAVCRGVLQLVVDAYACQHPGTPRRRSAQSVGIHLMTLYLVLVCGADPRDGPKLHRRMVSRPAFRWLEPPCERGRLTVASLVDARTAEAYVDAAWRWARDVWCAWDAHHAEVQRWVTSSTV
jgi:hypothetical protein